MASIDTSKGLWLDTVSGKVVAKEPERGLVLASPGDEVTDELRSYVDRFSAAAGQAEVPAKPAPKPAPKPAAKSGKA